MRFARGVAAAPRCGLLDDGEQGLVCVGVRRRRYRNAHVGAVVAHGGRGAARLLHGGAQIGEG
ncbi:hypothetical protein SFR_1630 [Streptomyces sp. FR-008]|nr:hypothetical protein SFR_1630 [Streptomyces sp. FR-008]